MKRWWLALIAKRLNPRTARAARQGRGPFFLIRHVGRSTGRVYETPLILEPVPGGFVGELTYGPSVQWYQNVLAAGGHCTVVRGGVETPIVRVTDLDAAAGLRAFGPPKSWLLRLLRRRDFITLHAERAAPSR